MNNNIKNYIDKLKEKQKKTSNSDNTRNILNKYFKDEIFEYEIIKGILSFKSISPILRTKIKLKKNIILKDFKNNNIYIRDII